MTTPVYNPKIPQPENSIDQGQLDFLNNFSTLFNSFSSDHVQLDSVSNAGNHTFARFVQQETGAATGTSEIAIYSKMVESQTEQIIYRTIGNGEEIRYSNYQIFPLNVIKNGNTILQVPYFTFLPGGIIMYFGEVYPNRNPFPLILEPAICTQIFGVNLGAIIDPLLFPSRASPVPNQEGKYGVVNLTFGNLIAIKQNYIIYGVL
jgi:hypothetical protein